MLVDLAQYLLSQLFDDRHSTLTEFQMAQMPCFVLYLGQSAWVRFWQLHDQTSNEIYWPQSAIAQIPVELVFHNEVLVQADVNLMQA